MHYILQTIAFQLLFLIVYDLFLKKETFFNTNRFYLLITPVVSLILPFIQIAALRESVPQELVIQLPAVVIGGEASVEGLTNAYLGNGWLNLQTLWIFGALLSLLFFARKLLRIFRLKRAGEVKLAKGFRVIKLPKTTTAFTFFGNIFLGEQLSEEQQSRILLHEKVHVHQRHSLDLLFFEILRILFWFNPLVYIFQKRATVLHEFIADQKVAAERSHQAYYQDLLQEVFQTEKISFINTFFNHSLIKKRIVMLQKSKSKKIVQLKYLLLVPVIAGMLFYTSCSQDIKAQETASAEGATDSEIIQKVENLLDAVAKKGEISKEEEDALKVLYVLTNPNGIETPEFEQVKEKVEIPFGVIERVPTFPGCEGMSNEESRKCFTQKVTQFVMSEFNTKVAKPEVTGKQKISVIFKIGLDGKVSKIQTRAAHPELAQEAKRVIEGLPQMTPGEQSGKKVGVLYHLPIIFKINE